MPAKQKHMTAEMTWDEMEVVEHENGALMFPSELRKRDKKGKVSVTPVLVRVPRPIDHLEARRDARKWLIELGIDAEKDPHLLEQAEDMTILAKAIRDVTTTGQFADTVEIATYDEGCLRDIKQKIETFKGLLDPRETVTTEEQFWRLLADIRRKGNLLPLVDIVGHEQPSCMMRMALEACNSPRAPSYVLSGETSTPEPSDSKS